MLWILAVWTLHLLQHATICSAFSGSPSTDAPVVVAGAGPASLYFAARYLQLNPAAKITVYEKRSRPARYSDSDVSYDGLRSFGFGLAGRARSVLDKVPGLLDQVKNIAVVGTGGRLWFVNHKDLCAEMLSYVEEKYGNGQLEFKFDAEIVGVSEDETVEVICDGEKQSVPYSLLVAADGLNSAIRQSLVDQGELSCERFVMDTLWKALPFPAQPNFKPTSLPEPGMKLLRTESLQGAIIPRFPDRFVALLFMGRAISSRQKNPFDARAPNEFREKLTEVVPEITEFPSDETLQKFLDMEGGFETTMKLSKHAVEKRKIALIGDAAVGMYSAFGQGAASGMERANFLAESLSNEKELEKALRSFSEKSIREGNAIAHINLLGHLMSIPLIGKLFYFPLFLNIVGLANSPEIPYSTIERRFAPFVWIGRFLWRLERIEAGRKANA